MLDTLRNSTNSWVVRILIALLVLSFAVWGITDVFSYRHDETIVQIDDTDVGLYQFRLVALQELHALSQEEEEQLDFEQAREKGIEDEVLDVLIERALLDNVARDMGLRVGKEQVVEDILESPNFRNAFGEFDRALFNQLLRSNGMNEEIYVEAQSRSLERQQIISAVRQGAYSPYRLAELLHLYISEERTGRYILFGDEILGELETPSEETLLAFYEGDTERFEIPELRDFRILLLQLDQLMENISIPEEVLRQEYEEQKHRFDRPEKRQIERLSFSSNEEATAALDRLNNGEDFLAIANERGFEAEDIDLGSLASGEFDNEAIEKAAFELEAVDDISEIIEVPLGYAIVRLREITPATESNYEESKSWIEWEMQRDQAAEEILVLHDVVEDERAAGKSLTEIAEELSIKLVEFEKIRKNGRDIDRNRPEEMPYINDLMKRVFETEPGIESDSEETTSNGFYWFETLKVHEPHIPTFEEARERIETVWERETRKERLENRAEELYEQAQEGLTLEEMAAQLTAEIPPKEEIDEPEDENAASNDEEEITEIVVVTDDPITRQDRGDIFPRKGAEKLFELKKGEFDWNWNRSRKQILLFQLDDISPADATKEEDIEEITDLQIQLTFGMRSDVVDALLAELRAEANVTINEDLLASPLVDPYYRGY